MLQGLNNFVKSGVKMPENRLYFSEINQKWLWVGDYESRFLPKHAGFKWCPVPYEKGWYTDDPRVAEKLKKFISLEDIDKLEQQLNKINDKLQESQATNADIEIPAPEGLQYMPFQKAGINFALKRTNTLIADEMGLGKTIQAIGYINANPDFKKILIVCPASLKLNWKYELEKWLINKLTISIANVKDFDPTSQILIVNYASLKKYHEILTSHYFWLTILDEAHYVKNHKAQRTKFLFGAPRQGIKKIKTKKIIALTGTPILNKPQEIWTIAHFLAPDIFSNWRYFHTKFCGMYDGRYGHEFDIGNADLEGLQEKLRCSIMVRREKKDVLKELPDKLRQLIIIDDDKIASEERKQLAAFKKKIEEEKQELQRKQKADKGNNEYARAIARLDEPLVKFSELARIRHFTGLAKVNYCVEHIKEMLEQIEKVIVFAHHKDVIQALKNSLQEYKPVIFTGDNNLKEKETAIYEFQNGNSRVFIGSIKAAGVGITLTASSSVVFCELDWTPANITQAEDRAHRIGQKDCVIVYHIVVDGTIDAKLAKMLVKKQQIIDSVISIDEIFN
jgi:SWI/SNF-related matrix-associated actin-dependent regulator 1 of chromatin subfamily A